MKSSLLRALFVVLACTLGTSAQHPAELAVSRTLGHARYKAAAAHLDADYDRFVGELIALTEVPAPPFGEADRATLFMRLARASGLTAVEQDPEGNVMALRRGHGAPLLVVAAHLDTVFPAGTDVAVRRQGSRLMAPGIGDNALGVATVLALARAFDAAAIETASDILFVGNVGEEGSGALRGMKYLFGDGRYRDRIATFIAIDGGGRGHFLTTGGVGSKRYRVTFNGPGGHSYGAFGLVNPANALAGAIARLSAIPVPSSPRTTHNVGVIGGGTSVNTIPSSAWMDVDLRSESPDELDKLHAAFISAMHAAADEENRARSAVPAGITVNLDLVGDRPSGSTAPGSVLVQTASAALRATGLQPELGWSSTDANLPMSLQIPAITIDAGLEAGRAHAPDEWLDVSRPAGVRGLQRALLIVLSVAGLRE